MGIGIKVCKRLNALAFAIILFGAFAAQGEGMINASQDPDPAAFLPSEEDLPEGFVRRPELDSERREGSLPFVTLAYSRSPASLRVSAAVGTSPAAAQTSMDGVMQRLTDGGYEVTPLSNVGHAGFTTRRDAFNEGLPPGEIVFVYFRAGSMLGYVRWADVAEEPNFERALTMARVIKRNMLLHLALSPPTAPPAAPTRLPPPPTAVRPPPPPSTCTSPAVDISPRSVRAPGTVTLTADGYSPNSVVLITVETTGSSSSPSSWTTTAGADCRVIFDLRFEGLSESLRGLYRDIGIQPSDKTEQFWVSGTSFYGQTLRQATTVQVQYAR